MSKTIVITTDSGRQFNIPTFYWHGRYAVVRFCEFTWDDTEPITPLDGYTVSYIPNGNAIAWFRSKRAARGFCMWMARHFAEYSPDNPEQEKIRKQLMGEICGVIQSYRGRLLW